MNFFTHVPLLCINWARALIGKQIVQFLRSCSGRESDFSFSELGLEVKESRPWPPLLESELETA